MTANALWTSFATRSIRRVSRRRVGRGMSDWRARAARVPAAGGALSSVAVRVCDRVLRAGAVAGTGVGSGAEIMRRLRLMIGRGRIGMCAVVGTTLGAGAGTVAVVGTTLGAGAVTVGTCGAIDRVMRRVGSMSMSTLGTGGDGGLGCRGGVLSWSRRGVTVIIDAMRLSSLMSCSASIFVMPLMSFAQSANAVMSLSCGVMVGLVMVLC